ncbi:hypothetical protein HHL16_24180 [Pseudoflavitalea sp. G-6-1-2]|uniref:hypothetical protein n=1 Tax=Pseudoflavitalea sp. G-6-1-2 TaxID=2728841 RepID=UPI00146ABDDD|nr:hypothetical protein [Pseudoflavitalea sp. G-6-1-2]NML24001.1 hypothetical protein [Pseudoflavitalea sp. G-6-1-2]
MLLLSFFGACKKGEQVETWTEFVDVLFDARKTALANNGNGIFIAAKYNGFPIEWSIPEQKIKVVEGKAQFAFYDTRSGKTVAEKTIEAKAGSKEAYTLFQPTIESPVSFVDPKEQEKEEAAPAGHIKVKVANYAQMLIPFKKVDMTLSIVYFDEEWNQQEEDLGIIRNVAATVGEADYQILPNGLREGIEIYSYVFKFTDHETGAPLLNHGGTAYSSSPFTLSDFQPAPVKNVYTLFVTPFKAWGETPAFIKNGEDFYEITTSILFAN